ncbi:MAG: 3'-5' exonuclease [Chloroflexi bacterium]|nr:3'-5' exonuclease [Chloroflexota bacterium]
MPFISSNSAYISIDVETAGPNSSDYSLLSIGACLVDNPQRTFYVELQPLSDKAVPAALAVCKLSMADLAKNGVPPAQAMARFEQWVWAEVPRNLKPVFVAFNAVFDWMFVNDYFHRFLGHNPFGHSALDMKAFFMGMTGAPWNRTGLRHITAYYQSDRALTHNALQDALDQAELFRRMLKQWGVTHNSPADTLNP